MKVKVGQWVRTTTGVFGKVKHIHRFKEPNQKDGVNFENGNMAYIKKEGIDYGSWTSFVLKVADTPQELIEVGDLVSQFDIHNAKAVSEIHSYNYIRCGIMFIELKDVKFIWTLNFKNGYDLQWEAK